MHVFMGGILSTSQKYHVSVLSGVSMMVLRNVSEELVRNVAEHTVCNAAGFTVRNVSGQVVSNVGGFTVRLRDVSGSGSGMVPGVGWHGSLLTNVGGQ